MVVLGACGHYVTVAGTIAAGNASKMMVWHSVRRKLAAHAVILIRHARKVVSGVVQLVRNGAGMLGAKEKRFP